MSLPDKSEILSAVKRVMAKNPDTKIVFRVKTVPTVEDFSNIGFNGLQELADTYRKEGRNFYKENQEDKATALFDLANKCESLLDEYNGVSTLNVDVEQIMGDCTKLLSELFPEALYMAHRGKDDDGMFFDFILGPPIEELVKEMTEGEVEAECDCEYCTAERERMSGIPRDQLN